MPTSSPPRGTRRALVAAAVVVVLSGCGGEASTPTEAPVSSAPGHSATTSAPELAIHGDLDIQSLPADAIPWNEVGLGWFLLTYDPGWNGREQLPGDAGDSTNSPTAEELYLVSPEASIYFVRDLTGLGNGRVAMWLGSAIGFHEDVWSGESQEGWEAGRVTAVDLQTGASEFLVDDWMGNERLEGVLPNGDLVTHEVDDYSNPVNVRRRDLSRVERLCRFGDSTWGSSIISPDGSRAICTALRNDGKSDVLLYDFATATSTAIDVFKYSPWEYYSRGWVDTSSVVIHRWDEQSNGYRYWTYNVDTQTLSDYAYDERQPPIRGFGANAHRVMVNGESLVSADSVTVGTTDGSLSAKVSPCRAYTEAWFSEISAVVACYDSTASAGTLYHANLTTGLVTILASPYQTNDWSTPQTQYWTIRVFPGIAP